jgi:EmrB/QacA subfamily drug resistance transporter
MSQTHAQTNAQLPSKTIWTILTGTMIAMFLGALDQTIIAAALPTIARELGDFNSISWVASLYLLATTAVTPLYGKISDIHGRRVTMLAAIVIFVVGSVACAMAPTMLALILARGLQGLGGGGLISLSQTIIADIVAPKERGKYQIFFASVYLLASLMGPMLGGFLTEHLHWSMIFWINLPIGLVAWVMTTNTLKLLPIHHRPHKLDIRGAVLIVLATITLMLALDEGGSRAAWLSPTILGMLGASLVLWVLFVVRIRAAEEPLIPIEILANPVVASATTAALFSMGTYVATTIFMPVYFDTARNMSAADSGLALIPFMVGTVVGATMAGQTMGRIAHYKRLPLGGTLVAAIAALCIAFFQNRMTLIELEALFTVIAIGLGTVLPTTTVAIQNAVKTHELGTATGAMNFFRQLGSALLVAVFGTILLNAGQVAPATTSEAGDRFFVMFLATAIGFGISFVALLFMEEKPLRSAAKHAAEAVMVD